MKKLYFVDPIAKARWVVGPGYMYPICSLHNAQHICPRQQNLNLPVEKVMLVPKVVRANRTLEGGCTVHYEALPVRFIMMPPVYGKCHMGKTKPQK